jgi:hypothetical protein
MAFAGTAFMHHGPLLPENVEKGAWGNSFPAREDEQALLSHAHNCTRRKYRLTLEAVEGAATGDGCASRRRCE